MIVMVWPDLLWGLIIYERKSKHKEKKEIKVMIMFGQVTELRAKSSRFWPLLCLPHTIIAYGKKIFAMVEVFSKQLEIITRSSWPISATAIQILSLLINRKVLPK